MIWPMIEAVAGTRTLAALEVAEAEADRGNARAALGNLRNARLRALNGPKEERDRGLQLTLEAVRTIRVQPMSENVFHKYTSLERDLATRLGLDPQPAPPHTPLPWKPPFKLGGREMPPMPGWRAWAGWLLTILVLYPFAVFFCLFFGAFGSASSPRSTSGLLEAAMWLVILPWTAFYFEKVNQRGRNAGDQAADALAVAALVLALLLIAPVALVLAVTVLLRTRGTAYAAGKATALVSLVPIAAGLFVWGVGIKNALTS